METTKLDCGHPLDEGRPAQVMDKNGKVETVPGWQFVLLDDGRKVCHACADQIILDCGHKPSPHEVFTTGYGTTRDGKKRCYACCAAADRAAMEKTGRAVLYLSKGVDGYTVGNWPGSLKLRASVRTGRHNIAGKRYDAWFSFGGARWHGVTYGDNTQLCHCRRLKS
jgi:hypothetical protein